MFSTFNLIASSSAVPTYSLDAVSAAAVQTPEDRELYLNYLLHNPGLSPLQKLFGLRASEEPAQKEITAHARRLYVYIHPDKVSESERERCTQLFKLVKQAEETILSVSASENTGGIRPSGSWSSHFDPVQLVLDALRDGKWLQAEKLCASGSLEDERLAILKSIISARLGDLPAALESVPAGAGQLRQIWLDYQELIERAQSSPGFVAQEDCYGLLNRMKALSFPNLPVDVASHSLHKLLMDLCLRRGDLIDYQKHLREAIRCCPSGLEQEKRQLIHDLRSHLAENYAEYENSSEKTNFIDKIDPVGELAIVRMQILEDIQEDLRQLSVAGAVDALEESRLDEALKIIEIELSSSERSGFFPYLREFFFSNPYSDVLSQQKLRFCYNIVKGLICFDQGDSLQAAHHFSLADQNLLLGLVSFNLHQYARAIEFWKKLKTERTEQYIFTTMNYCDTFYISEDSNFRREQLGQVDETQFQLMKKGFKRRDSSESSSSALGSDPHRLPHTA